MLCVVCVWMLTDRSVDIYRLWLVEGLGAGASTGCRELSPIIVFLALWQPADGQSAELSTSCADVQHQG